MAYGFTQATRRLDQREAVAEWRRKAGVSLGLWTTFGVPMTEGMKQELYVFAAAQELSAAEVARRAIEAYIQAHEETD